MQCAEDYVRFCCKYVLEHCMPDLQFINKMIDSTAIARLQQVCSPAAAVLIWAQQLEFQAAGAARAVC